MAANNPKGLEFHAIFEPDMKRMVKALRIVHEYRPDKPGETESDKVKSDEKNAGRAS